MISEVPSNLNRDQLGVQGCSLHSVLWESASAWGDETCTTDTVGDSKDLRSFTESAVSQEPSSFFLPRLQHASASAL